MRRLFSILIVTSSIFMLGCVPASTNNILSSVGSENLAAAEMPKVMLSDLEGRDYTFPEDFASDYVAITFGFAHEQKEQTEAWTQALLEMTKTEPKLSVFKVPVIDNSSMALRAVIRNGMRSKISEPSERQRTLTLFTEKDKFANLLGLERTTSAALVLFDSKGRVRWTTSEAPSQQHLAKIREILAVK